MDAFGVAIGLSRVVLLLWPAIRAWRDSVPSFHALAESHGVRATGKNPSLFLAFS